MLIFSFLAILQLVPSAQLQNNLFQNNIFTLSPTVIPGLQCQSQGEAVDMAIQSIDQSVGGVLSILLLPPLDLPCGDGVWTRVAYLNMTITSQQCPPPWRLYSAKGVRACGRPATTSRTGGCYSQNYTVQQSYQRVCGRIIGYQIGSTNVFQNRELHLSIDEAYVDGVSVTYGEPRQHIWTFAGGISEKIVDAFPTLSCPCALNGTGIQLQEPPALILLATIIFVNPEIH